ncbi:MAG: HAD-IG family 5'-nucleotidase [Sandaracinaceae bacterium]|nr:HAD-IG family 5'-nucleotidase [Sandaracinaceae bacterium]MCB9662442.1 HAD-IG family 5'-nucleotidase [Sandaracinaceae bacterium]
MVLELPPTPATRRIFVNRTLNLRSIEAIGFDMDYTLVHYRHEAWERAAYNHVRQRLLDMGWPVADLEFDPQKAQLGLVVDLEHGNVVKANRFGYVTRASHGTKRLEFSEQRKTYSRVLVDVSDHHRWYFLHTLFALSEACLFMQLVDLLDAGKLPRPMGYADLHRLVRRELDATHMEGTLKAEIIAAPERYIDVDPDLPLALMDLRAAGKKLLVITNSEWSYTSAIMRYVFDPYVDDGTWRDLFDLVVVSARKPAFFEQRNDIFEIVSDDGLLRPANGALTPGGAYLGGNASRIEAHLGLSGSQILYVGDHIFSDVEVSKTLQRWRTMLVLRELEGELAALGTFAGSESELVKLMSEKTALEYRYSSMRLALQRKTKGYGPQVAASPGEIRAEVQALREQLVALDQRIAPLARAAGELVNPHWGPLLRTGTTRSLLARQIEQSADVYTSRASNLLHVTPFEYLRSGGTSMPHDDD